MIQYAPITVSGDPFTTTISAYPDTASIVIYNESPFFLQITLVGSGVYGVAAYTADCFQVNNGFSGTISVTPIEYITTNAGTPPASVMFVQAYGATETLTRLMRNTVGTGYPISLNRLQNIGNNLPVGTTANAIVNDGNVAGTSIVEATVQGDSASAVSLTNDGVFKLGTAAHHGSISFDNGDITTDGAGNVSFNNGVGTLTWLSSTGNFLGSISESNSTGALTLNSSGSAFRFAAFGGITSRFAAFNFGQASGINGVVVTHGLGGTPSAVLILPIIAQPGSATVGVGNVGATTFTATCGAGTGFYWFAIR